MRSGQSSRRAPPSKVLILLVARVGSEYHHYQLDAERLFAADRPFMPPGVPPEHLALTGRPWTSAASVPTGRKLLDPRQHTSPSAVLRSQCCAAGFAFVMPRVITDHNSASPIHANVPHAFPSHHTTNTKALRNIGMLVNLIVAVLLVRSSLAPPVRKLSVL
jgi:hypothetical protein